MMTLVLARQLGAWRSCSTRVKPSMSGMWTSVRITAKGACAVFQALQGGGPALRQRGSHSEAAQHLPEDAAVRGVVVHDQHAQTG